jgi:hypothetical protein
MENNKKQTAVDIAFEKLANQGLLVTRDYKNLVVYREAKEMEKEQIINALQYGFHTEYVIGSLKYINQELEQYYKETYEQ